MFCLRRLYEHIRVYSIEYSFDDSGSLITLYLCFYSCAVLYRVQSVSSITSGALDARAFALNLCKKKRALE